MLPGSLNTSEGVEEYPQYLQDNHPLDYINLSPESLYPAVVEKHHEPQDGGAVDGVVPPFPTEYGTPDSRPNFMTSSAAVSIPRRKRASNSMCVEDCSAGTSYDLAVAYSDLEDELTTAKHSPSTKKKSMRRNGGNDTIGDGLSKSPDTGRKVEEQKAKPALEDIVVYKTCTDGVGDFGIGKEFSFGHLQLSFKKPPGSKLRPSYSCEGSRGAIRTDDGENVDIDINLGDDSTEPQEAVVFAGCLDAKSDTPQPHFGTSSVGDHLSHEYAIGNLAVVAMRRKIPAGPSTTIKMDIGIRRLKTEGERVNKLNRKCRVVYRLCIVERVSGLENSWRMVSCAQLVTGIITCEQQMGAPVITELSVQSCGMEGGVTIAGKGRNFQSRSDPAETTVMFEHSASGWKDYAHIYHKVTTKESIAFKVPPFRLPTAAELNMTEIPVSIVVTVDKRSAESTSFTYVIPKASVNFDDAPMTDKTAPSGMDFLNYLPIDDVMEVLDESFGQLQPVPSQYSLPLAQQLQASTLEDPYFGDQPLGAPQLHMQSEAPKSNQGQQYPAIEVALKVERRRRHCAAASEHSSSSRMPLYSHLTAATQEPMSTQQSAAIRQHVPAQQQVSTPLPTSFGQYESFDGAAELHWTDNLPFPNYRS